MTDTYDIGCVKWFNNKAGYGFLSVTLEGHEEPCDVFVHHSAITVEQEQYRYLVQGEYVEVKIGASSKGYKYQAENVRGIRQGRLMCETRNDSRRVKVDQPSYERSQIDDTKWTPVRMKKSVSQPSKVKVKVDSTKVKVDSNKIYDINGKRLR